MAIVQMFMPHSRKDPSMQSLDSIFVLPYTHVLKLQQSFSDGDIFTENGLLDDQGTWLMSHEVPRGWQYQNKKLFIHM